MSKNKKQETRREKSAKRKAESLRALKLREKFAKINKKKVALIAILVAVGAIELVQIFYPSDFSRPLMKIGGRNVGFISRSDAAFRAREIFESSRVSLNFDGNVEEFAWSDLGATLESEEEAFSSIFGYPLKEKLVPFSLFFGHGVGEVSLNFDDDRLSKFVEQYAKSHSVAMKKSSVSINDKGDVVLAGAVDGKKIDAKNLAEKIKSNKNSLSGENEIAVDFETIAAGGNEKSEKIKAKIEELIAEGSTVALEDKEYVWNRAKTASLISIDGEKLTVNEERLKDYYNEINSGFEKLAEPIKVSYVDGVESSREGGKDGRKISYAKLLDDFSKYFSGESLNNKITLQVEKIEPEEQKSYTFSRSQNGLQAKLEDIGSRYDVRLSVRQLDGNGWRAGYREYESTVSASTYKLYVALRVFKEMEQKNMNMNSQILGTTYADCFNLMIIHSTNPCAEEWIRQFGRDKINSFVYGLGVSNATDFTNPMATHTSAGDLTTTLTGIYNGGWAGSYRGYLLDLLANQRYRSGIPTGSKGQVYDKIGFYLSYTHDAGIVVHPQGTYVLAVMTNWGNWNTIAEITREIEEFMYP